VESGVLLLLQSNLMLSLGRLLSGLGAFKPLVPLCFFLGCETVICFRVKVCLW
jgi:hypothetical protein